MMWPLFIPCCSSMLNSEWALWDVGNVEKLAMNGFNIKRDRQLKTKCVKSSSKAESGVGPSPIETNTPLHGLPYMVVTMTC